MRFKTLTAVLLSLSATVCVAQAIPQQKTDTAAQQATQPKSDAAQAPAAAKGTTENDPDYVIGDEDVIAINVWHEPEMSRAMGVRPDGKISLPLIGEVVAEGKTPKQLQAELSKKLAELIKNPDVTVIVQDIKSQKFNVLGEVQKPGVYPLTKPMTILDAVAIAGGFRDFAKPKKMYILRRSKDGSNARVLVNYNNVIKGKDKNVELESRDTIIVP
jgi:polysaccharide biosynthesis/export protein